ncbi:MAG: hypothetical protein D6748_05895 [Calditrichaeota bacterium]|nr:MAG: hypothetical protein D6748_05895 [Calditrichota bacterium]
MGIVLEVNVHQFFSERKRLNDQLASSGYRYFSFQIWQEGLARYTEYKFLELLEDYAPSKEVTRLPDFEPFDSLKTKMYRQEIKKLLEYKLNEEKRRCFYSAGFAEGLLLDKLNKNWRERYFTEKYYVERYFP